jgi:sulfofructose kinase
MNTVDVVGFGENSVDLVCRVPVHPRPVDATAKVRMTSCVASPGGQVATTICTCAALGLRTRYLGVFGNDANGALVRAAMEARGVDLGAAINRPAPNRHAVIVVAEATGERVILWERDPRLAVTPADLDPGLVRAARLLHVDAIDAEAALAAATAARAEGVVVTGDIDAATDGARRLIDALSVPILSEHALEALTGQPDHERGLRRLRERHPGRLCVTRGAGGAMLLDGDRLYAHAGYRVQAVDTTAAGDIFRGAFIAALLRDDPPDRILRLANAAAALGCTRPGAIAAIPSPDEIETLAASG